LVPFGPQYTGIKCCQELNMLANYHYPSDSGAILLRVLLWWYCWVWFPGFGWCNWPVHKPVPCTNLPIRSTLRPCHHTRFHTLLPTHSCWMYSTTHNQIYWQWPSTDSHGSCFEYSLLQRQMQCLQTMDLMFARKFQTRSLWV